MGKVVLLSVIAPLPCHAWLKMNLVTYTLAYCVGNDKLLCRIFSKMVGKFWPQNLSKLKDKLCQSSNSYRRNNLSWFCHTFFASILALKLGQFNAA
jgi:hypothetical protein